VVLIAEDFAAQLLSRVQEFDCGEEPWAVMAANWIKQAPPFDSALKSMAKHGNSVWLHFLDAPGAPRQHLVGFSSLGVTRWPIPPPDGPKREIGIIPMLAIASAFQGKRLGETAVRYSDAIIQHVVDKARGRMYRELCLFVDASNGKAISLYNRFGFAVIGARDNRNLLRMLKLLD
jgi:ribosomal protein S18 acetylase RimI-like enzyme